MPDDDQSKKNSLGNILFVAIAVCLVCSVIVSTAAVSMKPQQLLNKELDMQQNILRAAGLLSADSNVGKNGETVDELFSAFEVVAVDLDNGRAVADFAVAGYDPIKAAKDDARSRELSNDEDIAVIGSRENVSLAFLLKGDSGLDKVVIPVRGYGLWGTLYGYLALEGDTQTIAGLGFYNQKETPGLGGEVDNPKWKALWNGVQLFNDQGQPAVDLVKSRSPADSVAAAYEVDALSGATLTTRGVENLVNFWTGDLAFGPYLKRLRTTI